MSKLKLIFWSLVFILLGLVLYRMIISDGEGEGGRVDPGRKSVQELLTRGKANVPEEISSDMTQYISSISLSDYKELEERNLFVQFKDLSQEVGPLPLVQRPTRPKVIRKKEEPKPILYYQGTLKIGQRDAVALKEEGGRSFFVGQADLIKLKNGEEYEVVDITVDEVILLKQQSEKEEKISIPKKK